MQVQASAGGDGPQILNQDAFSAANRERLSGPAFRTFLNIADAWGLTEAERLAVLGQPGRSTLFLWAGKARRGDRLSLPLDTLLRISAVLGIHKALSILFLDRGTALTWLRNSHSGPGFGGQSPLAVITFGLPDGPLEVRRYLDAWRGGTFASPVPAVDDCPPFDDDDIVII